MFNVWDFCFSSNAAFTAQIKRHWKITVEYHDEKRQKQKEDFEGYFSELLQHEIDHLEGRLFIDLIKDPSKIKMI
jgi:peptide deformylase